MKIVISLLILIFSSCSGRHVIIKKMSIELPGQLNIHKSKVTGRDCGIRKDSRIMYALGDALAKAPPNTIGLANVTFHHVDYFNLFYIQPCFEVEGFPVLSQDNEF